MNDFDYDILAVGEAELEGLEDEKVQASRSVLQQTVPKTKYTMNQVILIAREDSSVAMQHIHGSAL